MREGRFVGVTANRRELLRGAGALAVAGALGGWDAFAQGQMRPPNIPRRR
jgi:hypothetical protein